MESFKEDINVFSQPTYISEQLNAVLDSMPFFVVLVDEDHNIIYTNRAVQAATGKGLSELSGQYCPKAIHGLKSPIEMCPLEKSVETGKPVELEIYDDETKKWYLSSVFPTEAKNDNKRVFYHTIREITQRKTAEIKLKEAVEKLMDITQAGVDTIAKMIEISDPYTAGHQMGVGVISYQLALELGYSQEYAIALKTVGRMHDVGKIAIPVSILSKPGKLSDIEMEIIRCHSEYGYEILKGIISDVPLARVALEHHERINGSGYPKGLKGDEICTEAKIVAVADVLDAMTSHRPYRPKKSIEEAVKELESNAGTLYDEKVAFTAVRLIKENKIDLNSL